MQSRKKLPVTDLFYLIRDCEARITAEQGGARSGKTYQILLYIILTLLEPSMKDTGFTTTIVRKAHASLETSVMADFFDIIGGRSDKYPHALGIYNVDNHKKSSPERYMLNGNPVWFMGIDKETKKRGSKRDLLYINEANELDWDDWTALAMRTSGRIIIDWNPYKGGEWIYNHILPRKDCTLHKSTYRDNPFLAQSQIDEIESLKDSDPEAYKVFGLGERGELKGQIYTNWGYSSDFKGDVVYGLDFGFNNQTALIKIGLYDNELYVQEMLYKSGMTNSDLISAMESIGINDTIYCDSAEPQRIEELRRAGFDAKPANKEVRPGIDFVKRHKINVVSSPHIEKEIKIYRWKEDRQGNPADEPAKHNDHAMDAIRYGAYTKWFVPVSRFERVHCQPLHTSDERYLI